MMCCSTRRPGFVRLVSTVGRYGPTPRVDDDGDGLDDADIADQLRRGHHMAADQKEFGLQLQVGSFHE